MIIEIEYKRVFFSKIILFLFVILEIHSLQYLKFNNSCARRSKDFYKTLRSVLESLELSKVNLMVQPISQHYNCIAPPRDFAYF